MNKGMNLIERLRFCFEATIFGKTDEETLDIRKSPIMKYIENLQSHCSGDSFFIYNLLVQFLTMANKLLELLFLRKTPHWVTSPKDR